MTEATRNYCSHCYSAAAEAGRTARMTSVSKYPVCELCESRIREGLTHYIPSNGTEFDIFFSHCQDCAYFSESEYVATCAHGILDKLLDGMAESYDSMTFWFDPADLNADTCPATCKRWRHRGDEHAPRVPTPDIDGQMTFDDVDIPHEPSASERSEVSTVPGREGVNGITPAWRQPL